MAQLLVQVTDLSHQIRLSYWAAFIMVSFRSTFDGYEAFQFMMRLNYRLRAHSSISEPEAWSTNSTKGHKGGLQWAESSSIVGSPKADSPTPPFL